MTSRLILILAALFLGPLALAGCGGSDDGTQSEQVQPGGAGDDGDLMPQ